MFYTHDWLVSTASSITRTLIHKTKLSMVAWACILLAACMVVGAAPENSDLTNLSLEDLMKIKITTASKKPEKLSASPAAVFVIDSEDIYRYGYRTLGEALRSITGFYVSSDRSYDYVGVRGYMRPSDYSTRVLLLINGHRLNDPIYDQAPIGEDFPVDMESVDHIEVVKGPGSSLWGTNALLAVINVITRSGQEIAGSKVSAGTDKIFAEYGSVTGELDLACSMAGVRSSGEKSIYFPEFDSPETNNGLATNIDETEATQSYLSASYKNLKLFYSHGSRSKVLPTAAYATIFNDPRTTMKDIRSLVELSYESPRASANSRSLLARIFYDEYHYLGDWICDYPPVTLNKDNYLSQMWGTEIRLSQPMTRNISLTYGAEYLRAYRIDENNYDLDPYESYILSSSSRITQSLYAHANYTPTTRLSAILGARCDDYSTFGRTWSPRAALVYSPKEGTSIKALYGNAFRAPNCYEVTSQDPNRSPISPEKIQTQELVWEQQIGNNSRLITSLFRYNLSKIIGPIPADNPWDTPYMINQGSATSSGIETQFETRTAHNIRGYAGISIMHATNNGKVITNSPDFLITSGLSLPVLENRYFISPQLRTIGRLITRSGQAIGAATILDLVVTTAGTADRTNISLAICDLFNKTTFMPSGDEVTQEKIPQMGRNARLLVSHRF